MLDPYGDDDEDFDLNFLLNRNANVIELATNVFTSDKIPEMSDAQNDVPSSTVRSFSSISNKTDLGNTYAR